MSKYSMFDRFPTELLHTVFDYFFAAELFVSFYDVSPYVNISLGSYSSYRFNCQSISKSQFRHVCLHVRPEQVISLTLSDGDQTPGQSEVFFRRFQIEQFTRLRSLTLIDIEFDSIRSIFTNLSQLSELSSLTFNARSIRHTYGSLDANAAHKLQQINTLLRGTYARLFPRLYFLSLKGGWVFESIPLPQLVHLQLDQCPTDKLATISILTSKLKSLAVSLVPGQMSLENNLLPSGLIRLKLIISGRYKLLLLFFSHHFMCSIDFPVTFSVIHLLLSDCLRLKHLELHLRGYQDLANGENWRSLTKFLQTFHFNFSVHISNIQRALKTFQTPFWLTEKRWFVAYKNQRLFTIPHFTPDELLANSFGSLHSHSTAPSLQIFYQNVTKLIMNDMPTPRRLLSHPMSQLFSMINDLCRIRCLSVSSLKKLSKLDSIMKNMPHLSHLIIEDVLRTNLSEQTTPNSYKQIRTLEIGTDLLQHDESIDDLFRLFPDIEHFIYRPDIQSIALMTRFIDGFKQLSSASFNSIGPLYCQNVKYRFNTDFLLLKSRRLTPSISVCRIYHLPNTTSSFGIHWWIEE